MNFPVFIDYIGFIVLGTISGFALWELVARLRKHARRRDEKSN